MSRLRLAGLCLLAASGLPGAAQVTGPAPPAVALTLPNGLRVTKSVRTFKDLKEERAVRQKYDFSCGAAALTTLLRHYYELNVTEESVVNYIIHKRGLEEALRRYKEKQGFSLLDLKMAAGSVGFKAAAYAELTLAELVALDAPAIVPIRTRNYDHFVVFRGLCEDRVILTDPIIGNLTMRAGNFVEAWRNGIGMVLHSRQGRRPVNWRPATTPPPFVTQDMTRSLLPGRETGFTPRLAGEF